MLWHIREITLFCVRCSFRYPYFAMTMTQAKLEYTTLKVFTVFWTRRATVVLHRARDVSEWLLRHVFAL